MTNNVKYDNVKENKDMREFRKSKDCTEHYSSLEELRKLYKITNNDEVKVNQIIEKINEIKK